MLFRFDFPREFLYTLKSIVDVADEFVLNEALLHLKHLSCLLQELELLNKADISERDKSTALLVEIDSGSVDYQLMIFVFEFIWPLNFNHVSEHDVSLSLIPAVAAVFLVKNVLQGDKTISLECLSSPQRLVDALT